MSHSPAGARPPHLISATSDYRGLFPVPASTPHLRFPRRSTGRGGAYLVVVPPPPTVFFMILQIPSYLIPSLMVDRSLWPGGVQSFCSGGNLHLFFVSGDGQSPETHPCSGTAVSFSRHFWRVKNGRRCCSGCQVKSLHTYLLQTPADATEHGKDILSGYHAWRKNAIITTAP